MDTLEGMKTVIAVIETGSFTAASERLSMSKALVSKYVGQVEKQLNIRLFNRTTRRLTITDAGKAYYQHALNLIEQYEALVDTVTESQSSPSGKLRISAPIAFGEIVLAPMLPKFLRLYPRLEVELHLSNRPVDMIEEGVDVRLRIGDVSDSNLIAREVGRFELMLVASPSYLAEKGTPKDYLDLSTHDCIIDSNYRIAQNWPIKTEDGQQFTITVKKAVAANSPSAVTALAIAGAGIALTPSFVAKKAISDGTLQRVLPNYYIDEFTLTALYPHRNYLAKKVRCFLDFILVEYQNTDLR